ncbi:MAG TPA: hypothetical protein VG796_21460 [Verrucomicrobiales bacterium]|nr:hypothetical protein [Verrucomicrobiales bacterium]
MSVTPPDAIPAKGRRKRLWLNPKRWRFWIVTLPLAFWIILLILVWWPGLTLHWVVLDKVYFVRQQSPAWSSSDGAGIQDQAVLRFGPVLFDKVTYPPGFGTGGPHGFRTYKTHGADALAFAWEKGRVLLTFRTD